MNWDPFGLFKQKYNPFGCNGNFHSHHSVGLQNSQNTARSLFANTSLENEFRRLQNITNQQDISSFNGHDSSDNKISMKN